MNFHDLSDEYPDTLALLEMANLDADTHAHDDHVILRGGGLRSGHWGRVTRIRFDMCSTFAHFIQK